MTSARTVWRAASLGFAFGFGLVFVFVLDVDVRVSMAVAVDVENEHAVQRRAVSLLLGEGTAGRQRLSRVRGRRRMRHPNPPGPEA